MVGGVGKRCRMESVVMFFFDLDLLISVSVFLVFICNEMVLMIGCMCCC